jgi:hypothetical protein
MIEVSLKYITDSSSLSFFCLTRDGRRSYGSKLKDVKEAFLKTFKVNMEDFWASGTSSQSSGAMGWGGLFSKFSQMITSSAAALIINWLKVLEPK